MVKIAIFDIDNTLTESRREISPTMSKLLSVLIDKMPVALISGESLVDFERQIISRLSHKKKENLYALPTSGAELYEFKSGAWQRAYSYPIDDTKRRRIFEALAKTLQISPIELGKCIYDRGSQITYSALGKEVSLEEKYAWDPTKAKRKALVKALKPKLSGISITIGGSTSIDFTQEGIDKAFGVSKLLNHVHINSVDAVYVGDALSPGGNDEPVIKLGVKTIPTQSLLETEKIIERIINGGL
jgi:phosphomannomutase